MYMQLDCRCHSKFESRDTHIYSKCHVNVHLPLPNTSYTQFERNCEIISLQNIFLVLRYRLLLTEYLPVIID